MQEQLLPSVHPDSGSSFFFPFFSQNLNSGENVNGSQFHHQHCHGTLEMSHRHVSPFLLFILQDGKRYTISCFLHYLGFSLFLNLNKNAVVLKSLVDVHILLVVIVNRHSTCRTHFLCNAGMSTDCTPAVSADTTLSDRFKGEKKTIENWHGFLLLAILNLKSDFCFLGNCFPITKCHENEKPLTFFHPKCFPLPREINSTCINISWAGKNCLRIIMKPERYRGGNLLFIF